MPKKENKEPMPKDCCPDMKEQLEKDDILSVMVCEPFRPLDKIPPTVYIFSDGGHGGGFPIKYCPFCGTKIEFSLINQ